MDTVRRTTAAHREWASVAAGLHRLRVRPPCPVTGVNDVPIAYYAGCSSAATIGHDANTTPAGIRRTARRLPTATLVAPGGGPPGYASAWTEHRVAGLRVYQAPSPTAGGRQ
ncbi:hypothetical protein ABZ464_05420 [Streptomyces sp. NPDC005820]|uniref:hypothetical protein n=1 Tax=Streptomyces sp. NPDC005820 TaxID=3157069 RepID=UPI0033C80971